MGRWIPGFGTECSQIQPPEAGRGSTTHQELEVMHQSFSTMPIPPPPSNRRVFAYVLNPGEGAFAILSWPGVVHFAYPGTIPRHLIHMVSKPWVYLMETFAGQEINYVADWLVHQGLGKLVDVFKSKCFLRGGGGWGMGIAGID